MQLDELLGQRQPPARSTRPRKGFTANHFLEIRVLAFDRTRYIWQQDVGGIDAVRFTQGDAPRWQHNVPRVPSFSGAGGNRMLEIHEDGDIELHESAK